MARLPEIRWDTAPEKTKVLLDQVATGWDLTPAMTHMMANSSAVLQGYLALRDALYNGVLSLSLSARLGVMIAEINGSPYCLALQATLGWLAGLDDDELEGARWARSSEPKVEAALGFARTILTNRGKVTDEEVDRVRLAGYADEEIAEIVGQVVLHVFTNYFNLVAQTETELWLEDTGGPEVA